MCFLIITGEVLELQFQEFSHLLTIDAIVSEESVNDLLKLLYFISIRHFHIKSAEETATSFSVARGIGRSLLLFCY